MGLDCPPQPTPFPRCTHPPKNTQTGFEKQVSESFSSHQNFPMLISSLLFQWHEAIPLPTTQISEVLSHQDSRGADRRGQRCGKLANAGASRISFQGPCRLSACAKQTEGSGLLQPHAVLGSHLCARFQRGKVTADRSTGSQLSPGPARSRGYSSNGTSQGRWDISQVTTGVLSR